MADFTEGGRCMVYTCTFHRSHPIPFKIGGHPDPTFLKSFPARLLRYFLVDGRKIDCPGVRMAVFGFLGTPDRVFSPQMSTSGHLYAPRGTRRQLGDTPASFAVRITLLSMQNRVFAPMKLGAVKTRICMVMTLGMPVSMAECHWTTPRGIREAWETSTGR